MNESEQIMTRYLLGELGDGEQAALEEKYFTDPRVFDELVKAENELVDTYACGRLSPHLRERFEQYYLAHPERRERANFARALAAKIDQVGSEQPVVGSRIRLAPWRRLPTLFGQRRALAFSMALALLLLALSAGWFLLRTRRSQEELARTQAAHAAQEQRDRELQQQLADERARKNDLTDESNRARPQVTRSQPEVAQVHTTPAFVTLLLTAGETRGTDTGPAPGITIPNGTEQVRIQLNLKESDYANYRIGLQALGGETIFSRQGIKPKGTGSGSTFVIIVPARRFAAGDYILTLRGVRPDGEVDDVSKSIFHVAKK